MSWPRNGHHIISWQLISCSLIMWWPFLNKLAINHFHWMYMLINFVNLFQIIYKGVKCVQSAFTKKTFCMQKNERSERIKSNFHLFLFFSLCSKRMSVGSIENRSQLELFSFTHISNLASRKWLSVLTLANKVKNYLFLSNKNYKHSSWPLSCP